MPFVNQDNARKENNYSEVINEIAEKKVCPFCPDQIHNFHKLPIEEKNYWLVTQNMYAYKPTKFHYLLIHKKHIEAITEISDEAWAELKQIISDTKVSGGTFMCRFGETKYTGATVTHLHAHIIQSDPDNPDYDKAKGVMTRVG